MEAITIIFIIFGLGYSVLLISVGSSVAEDFSLSPSAKKWLIFLMIVVPILGLLLAKLKTRHLGSNQTSNSHGDTMSASGSSYSDSGDCGGGSE